MGRVFSGCSQGDLPFPLRSPCIPARRAPPPSLNEAFSSRKRLAPFDKAVNFGRGEWGVSSGSLQSAALTDAAGERAQETALKTDRQTQGRKSIEVGSDTETQEHSMCLHTYTHRHTRSRVLEKKSRDAGQGRDRERKTDTQTSTKNEETERHAHTCHQTDPERDKGGKMGGWRHKARDTKDADEDGEKTTNGGDEVKLARSRGSMETQKSLAQGPAGPLTFPGAGSVDPGLGSGPVWSGYFYSLGGMGWRWSMGWIKGVNWKSRGQTMPEGNVNFLDKVAPSL